MATTAVSERPAIEPLGTIGAGARCAKSREESGDPGVPRLRHGLRRLNRRHASRPSCSTRRRASYSSIKAISCVAMTTEVPDLLSSMNSRSKRWPRLGSTLPVGSSASRSCGRAITARAMAARCFSPPDSTGGNAVDALAETHPLQQLDDLGAVGGLILAEHAQRQRHVLVSGHVVEQPEILKHDADAAAQRGAAVLGQRRGVLVEHRNQPARRLERQKQHAQQRGFAGAGRPGEELERMGVDAKAEVAQDLRAEPVAQADILESDHPVPPNTARADCRRRLIRPAANLPPPGGAGSPCRFGFQSVNGSPARLAAKLPCSSDSPMLIVCPNCATSYDRRRGKPAAERPPVRCVRCRTVWHAELPHPEKLVAAAEALAPGAVEPAMAGAAAEPPLAPPAATADFAASAAPEEAAPKPTFEPPAESPPPGSAEGPNAATVAGDPAVEVESPPIAPADLDAEAPPIDVEADRARRGHRRAAPGHRDRWRRGALRVRAKRKKWHWPLSRLQSGILALLVADAIIVGWRADFVRAMPQTASFYAWIGLPVNLRGLDFDSLTTATEQHEGVPILVVEGNIVNDTSKPVERAAAAVCGPQCRATGDLFLDRRAAARGAAAGRGGRPSAPGSPRRRRTPTTCWSVSSTAATSSTETR